jgi:lysophospholipid acyltransferase (LPLAT)-like uncharacterized protein
VKQTVLGVVAWLIYRVLSCTWRITWREPDTLRNALRERRPFILAHWHGDSLALLPTVKRYRLATLASASKDGRIMTTVLRLLGARVSVGSSSRGGAAGLRSLMRDVRADHNCGLAVDGPRGPIYKLKPGVLEVSRLLNCPIFYASVSCDRAFNLHRSWDRAFLPKPFARVQIEWRGPMGPLARTDDPRHPLVLGQLEHLMLQAKRDARVPGQQVVPDMVPLPEHTAL